MEMTMSPKVAEKAEQDEYEVFGVPPAGFDAKDKERGRVFSQRLRNLRKEKGCTQAMVARELGLTTMAISKYEKGNFASIPVDYLRRLASFYQVTSHYLLGYIDDKDKYLRLDKDRSIIMQDDGTPRTVEVSLWFAPAPYQKAVEEYKNLYEKDTEFFYLINKMITSGPGKQRLCKNILKELMAATCQKLK